MTRQLRFFGRLSAFPCLVVLAPLTGLQSLAAAESGSTPAIATAEVQKRYERVAAVQEQIVEGEALLQAGKTQEALQTFEVAYTSLPDAPIADETRQRAIADYVDAGVRRAGELAATGDIAAARALLDKLDAPAVAPGNAVVAKLRARLNDPDRYPPALTAAHVKRVEDVQRLLTLANSQREIGNYDQALRTFDDVLRIDPYNTAARRGQEATQNDRARYFDAARDQTRATMLNEVNKDWEAPVPLATGDISKLFGAGAGAGPLPQNRAGGREAIARKLHDLRIAHIDFSGATIQEVVEYLRVRARDLDPEGKGIDFVVSLPADAALRPVTLDLSNVPLEDVLRYATEMAGLRYRVEDFAVRLISTSEADESLVSRTYQVPPDFISSAAVDAGAGATPDPFAQSKAGVTATNLQFRRLGAKEFLESRGVTFPEGASASYSPATNTLIVRNTAKNLEIVDLLVDQAVGAGPKQVVIEVRALDVGQEKLKELGFDWLLGGFGVNADNVQLAGGTIGNQQSANFLTQNFTNLVGGVPIGANPITAGLRSSGDLVSNQTIEDVLYGAVTPITRRSPGVFSLTGVFTDPQFQVVVRALDQKKGLDLVAQPSVVTKSGQKANVQLVREMIYPTEFDPPQIPTNFGFVNVQVIVGGVPLPTTPPPVIATPATPTAFETKKVGVVLDVEPLVSEDGRSIDMTITPEITDFVGFVNYGSPIRALDQFKTNFAEITENRIFQPIFSTRRIATAVKVWDGATVVLGGLISDNQILIEDKVPGLGDIPAVGRAFRSKVTRRRMKNMLIFVTAKVIDPSGARVHPQPAGS